MKNNKLYVDSSCIDLENKDYLENYIYCKELLDKLKDYFESDNEKPLYIGIIGTWGSGKTSIVNTVLHQQNNKIKIFKYDAWKYEEDSFRRSFIQSILLQSDIKSNDEEYKKIIESLYEDYSISSNSIIERIKLSKEKDKNLNLLSIIITICILLALIIFGVYKIMVKETTLGNILTLMGTIGIFNIFYSTTVYSKSKLFSAEQFYNSFIKILSKSKGKDNIVLIDNLDRCNSEELKKTLNTIKGFYLEDETKMKNKEKIVFIIPLDINSLNKAYSEYTLEYLDKIFDDMIYIKPKYNTDKLDFINKILEEYPEINKLINNDSKSIIINSTIQTPREIIKTINDYVTEYNILLSKNSKKFVENSNNRNYLMKTVIIKRKYYDFYKLAYEDINSYLKIDQTAKIESVSPKFNNQDELIRFLKINLSIKPTDYYDFFQSQNIKKYNQIPEQVKNAILSHDIEYITTCNVKDKIIEYYKNIYNDVYNRFWNTNILNKYITLISLYKISYFNKKELADIMLEWNIIFQSRNFKDMNINNIDIITFENELFFATEMYQNKDFNLFLIDCLNDNLYKVDNDDVKYEMVAKWFSKSFDITLNEKHKNLIYNFCQYVINKQLYKNDFYLNILFSSNIKLIETNLIKSFIYNIIDNKNLLKIINNLDREKINNNILSEELCNWINRNKINDLKLADAIINYLINNKKSLSYIGRFNIEFDGNNNILNEELILNIMDYFIERNIYSDALFNLVKEFKDKPIISKIISKFADNKPEKNSNFLNKFINLYFELSNYYIKLNFEHLNKIINSYINSEKEILTKIIDKGLLKEYYKTLKISENREHIIQLSIDLISNNFAEQLKNMFIYETSKERMQKLVESHKSIKELVEIINQITKKNYKSYVLKVFIELLKDKDNIIDDEIKSIHSLNIDEENRQIIQSILIKKETINRELVGV